jgi:DNA-binding transcriptional ArsR family regulator
MRSSLLREAVHIDPFTARRGLQHELVEETALSQPSVSKHLRVLREAGLVEARSEAQRRIYRVRPEPLRELDEWLAPYRRLWASRLDALEEHLGAIQDDHPRHRR